MIPKVEKINTIIYLFIVILDFEVKSVTQLDFEVKGYEKERRGCLF